MGSRRTLVGVVAALVGAGWVLAACGSTSTTSDDRAPGEPAPGVTDDTLTIGVRYLENGDKLNQQLGSKVKEGDQKAFIEAVVADINASGGIAGREVEVVLDGRDALSEEPYDQQDQAACAVFTQDHEVLAVLQTQAVEDSYVSCLEDGGAGLVTAETTGMTQETFDQFPGYTVVSGLRLDRVARLQPEVLDEGGYFTGWDPDAGEPADVPVEVGIITQDTDPYNYALDTELLPGLADVGASVEDSHVLRLKVPESEAEVEAAIAELQNAILKMQSDGVTHVIVFEQNGSMTQFFTQMAAEQGYRPRLGVNSGNAVQVGLTDGYLTGEMVAGAVGMGWAPLSDLPAAETGPGSEYDNDSRSACLDLMRAEGLDVSGNAGSNAVGFCDVLYFIQAALEDAPEEFTTETLQEQVDGLGAAFESGAVGPTEFTAEQHDGVAQVHVLLYDESCTCMRYDGDPVDAG